MMTMEKSRLSVPQVIMSKTFTLERDFNFVKIDCVFRELLCKKNLIKDLDGSWLSKHLVQNKTIRSIEK